jgi:nicotinamide-nucleotide amidase
MPERNRVQAMFPRGSRPIPNPHGSAPGIEMRIERRGTDLKSVPRASHALVFALPGVPAEMYEMWHASVAPAIRNAMPEARVIRHRRIKCFGTGESHLEAMLPDLIRRGREPSVGITVHKATITLRISAHGASPDECAAAMRPTIDTIHASLGALVFGEEDDELQHVVARLLAASGKTLSVAEWGTGGLVGHWLAEAMWDGLQIRPTASRYLGGIVVQNAEAAALVGIDRELIDRHGPTSCEVAAALASGCRERFGSDYALAIGDFPPLDSAATSPPRCYIALSAAGGTTTKPIPFAAHPDILKDRTAKEALNLLRLSLL